jgi:hypothetical protein
MKGLPRLLIALSGGLLVLAVVAGAVILSGRSLIVIENRGETTLNLSVETTHAGDFSWTGELEPGQRILRTAKFTADGGVVATCRDASGVNRTTGGYVTPGWPHRVDVTAASCTAIRVDADQLP